MFFYRSIIPSLHTYDSSLLALDDLGLMNGTQCRNNSKTAIRSHSKIAGSRAKTPSQSACNAQSKEMESSRNLSLCTKIMDFLLELYARNRYNVCAIKNNTMIKSYKYAVAPAMRAITSPSFSCNQGYVMQRGTSGVKD